MAKKDKDVSFLYLKVHASVSTTHIFETALPPIYTGAQPQNLSERKEYRERKESTQKAKRAWVV